jgi:hypothetical protein
MTKVRADAESTAEITQLTTSATAHAGASTKVCTRCDTEKPTADYYRRRSARDGLNPWCKECVREYHRALPKGHCHIGGCSEPAPPYQRMCRMHAMRVQRQGSPHKTRYPARGHHDDPSGSDATVVVTLRQVLEHQRAQDTSFSLAWSGALQIALAPLPSQTRREWQLALHETRSAWQSSFYRLPAPKEHRALGVLRLDAESWTVVYGLGPAQRGRDQTTHVPSGRRL